MLDFAMKFLACPACRADLALDVYERDGDHVHEGCLTCRGCDTWYPITSGVPRLLVGEFRGDHRAFAERHGLPPAPIGASAPATMVETRSSFSDKWNRSPRHAIDDPTTEEWWDTWTATKFGYERPPELYEFYATRRRVLDVGCGVGQNLLRIARRTQGFVLGLDLSAAADHAYANTRRQPNVAVVQADLMHPPFRAGSFDLITSDGVLHHTPSTAAAFASIAPLAEPGGFVGIHVYRKQGPIHEFATDHMRASMTEMTAAECWEACKPITAFGKSLSDMKVQITVPEDIPLLEIKAGTYDLQRFVYYHFFKCFWNDLQSFDENNLSNFDHYHPTDAHRHTVAEVESWYRDAGLTDVKIYLKSPNGVSAVGARPQGA